MNDVNRNKFRYAQRGQAFLLLVITLVLGAAAIFYSLTTATTPEIERDRKTAEALAKAKDALIAYASGRDSTNRPGELPCPDTNNNGTTESSCNTAASRIGRLPWATLGIPDLRDGSGERLWYAVSSNFLSSAKTTLNSNTVGEFTVTGISPASNVIAIVFAPGTVVAGQSRTTANVNNAAHYLESENASVDTTFTTAMSSGTFNDRLLAITPAMFFPQVEMRVAREARVFLNAYFANPKIGYFPVAEAYGGGGKCVASNQGVIPGNPASCGVKQSSWAGAGKPSWFSSEKWEEVLFYAVAPACVDPDAINCSGAGGFLTVNGIGKLHAIIIAPGVEYTATGQIRPCATITDCLEAPNTISFPSFTHVPNSTTTNDRVVIIAP